VPFIEYTPAGFPYHPPKEWPRFTPGSDLTLFETRNVLFGAPICLEDALPDQARSFANTGAEALVALINTENFLGTSQSLEHLRRARLTAIASGLPMVRAANSGISSSIDAQGRITARAEEGTPKAASLPVGVARPTFYRVFGDLGSAVLLLMALGAGFWVAQATTTLDMAPPKAKR
jgi:apolipoprotein N-acyltransferase